MNTLPLLGLGLITIAWLVMFYLVYNKKKKMLNIHFLMIYAIGAFALSYAGFRAADVITGGLNLVTGLLALVMGYYVKE
jgi:hypothetical protein